MSDAMYPQMTIKQVQTAVAKRKLATLTRADIGKRITFTSTQGRQIEGTLRAFTHGVFSNTSKGEVDIPLVGINLYTIRSHEHHWATPETVGTLAAPADQEGNQP